MNKGWMPGVAAVAALVTASSSVADAPPTPPRRACGAGPHDDVCLLLDPAAPAKFAPVFDAAVRLAVEAAFSDALARDFATFKARHGAQPELTAAWRDVDPVASVAAVRAKLPELRVTTFGGAKAWWQYRFSGNIAWDGTTSGPVRLNRYGLGRPAVAVAATLIHEMGHRAGLSHPSSSTNLKRAFCEPAYVLGSLAAKAATGTSWTPGPNDCPLLADLPAA